MLARAKVRYFDILARALFVVFGGAAIVWGMITFPIFWRQASIEYVARHIISGASYKREVLMGQIPAIETAENSTLCRPIALWSAAIIRLRMVEQASRKEDGKPVDARLMETLDTSTRRSLSCSAAEPFLWLILHWVEHTKNRTNPDYSQYLRMSYRLGPNEGWVALKRNPITFAEYERLPPDLAANAIRELMALINSGFYQQAVDIFSGPAWRLRDTILPHLAALPPPRREDFARTVYNHGLDVKILGIEPPNFKP